MSFLQRAAELGHASTFISDEGQESFVKSASESDITINDMYMAHNLTNPEVDLYTNEGVVPQDEGVAESRLVGAVDLIVKQASVDPLSEEDAVAYLGEIGLTADDYNEIQDLLPEDLIQKVANDMDGVEQELTADDAVWDKVAEAHEFLTEAGLNPVESINFAADFNEAEGEEAQDKVASEASDLSDGEIDKIAEAVEYLSDIEGIHPADLMAEWDKVASKGDAVKKGLGKVVDAFSGKGVANAEARAARSFKIGKKKLRTANADQRRMPGDNKAARVKASDNLRKINEQGKKGIRSKKLSRAAIIGGTGASAAGGAYAAS